MKERVAKALREELQNIGYGVGTINAGQLSDALARAAIAAMREPTEDMIEKGVWSRSEDGRYGPRETAVTIYQAMIDAAAARS